MNFESIHNYYEPLVIERIMQTQIAHTQDEDFLNDVACVALNSLPPRYVRHDVDMAFFLTTHERTEMAREVNEAVDRAIERVRQHRDERERKGFSSLT
jgi:hypothetical protein